MLKQQSSSRKRNPQQTFARPHPSDFGQPQDQIHVSYLLHQQVGSLPLVPPGLSEVSATLTILPSCFWAGHHSDCPGWEGNFFSFTRICREGALENPVADTCRSVTILMKFPENTAAACLQSWMCNCVTGATAEAKLSVFFLSSELSFDSGGSLLRRKIFSEHLLSSQTWAKFFVISLILPPSKKIYWSPNSQFLRTWAYM